jgi:uncharacterized protein
MVNVVFDTVIYVRGLINPYSWWGKVLFCSKKDSYRLFLSQSVLTEILEVLDRPELTKKFRSIQGMDRRAVLDILANARIVKLNPIQPICRDVKDDKFLATAFAAKADYLVTEDNDLLVLKEYDGTKILTAKEFLDILEYQ